jgi:perosamine synthetase
MSLHGISRHPPARPAALSWAYDILAAGYKYNLTDIAAAIGIEQLKKCERFWEARRRIAGLYDQGFAGVAEIATPIVHKEVSHAWQMYVLRVAVERLCISRDQFIARLNDADIGTSVHYKPLHLHPFYRQRFGYRPQDLPHATAAAERVISLPIYPALTEADVRRVVEAVRTVVEQNGR